MTNQETVTIQITKEEQEELTYILREYIRGAKRIGGEPDGAMAEEVRELMGLMYKIEMGGNK